MTKHLALTALESCWAPEGELALLGPWCITASNRELLGGRVHRILRSPWRSRRDLAEAHRYVTALQESLLPPLAAAMNRMHGIRRSERYWRILLGAWLLSFLPSLYERFRSLEAAYAENEAFTTAGLDARNFTVPHSSLELPRRIIGDHYNLQLYTRLLAGMNRPFTACRIAAPAADVPPAARGWVRSGLELLSRKAPGRASVVSRASSFSRTAEAMLALRLNGRLRPALAPTYTPAPVAPDAGRRAALSSAIAPYDLFTKLLRDILPAEMPTCYVEGYAAIVRAAESSFPPPPRAILSANAWYYDEAFKHWSGLAQEGGTLLLGIQHGGNYGGGDHLPSEAFEIGLVDRYYSWGWTKARYGDKVRPMPAAKLVGRRAVGASNSRRGILLVTTHLTRYPLNFLTSIDEFERYLANHEAFVAALPGALRPHLRARLHREDFGWEIRSRWRGFAPDVAIEGWEVPFADSLRDCRIYVCDHHSTTFVEALGADKPTVLFWPPDTVDLAPEFVHLYQGLRETGILHDTPAAAAAHLGAVYDDVAGWWRAPALQQARAAFCDVLGRTSPSALEAWRRELSEGLPRN